MRKKRRQIRIRWRRRLGAGHAVLLLEISVVNDVGCSAAMPKRPKLARILSDPSASVIVVEHRDRLARLGVEHLAAALAASGRRIVIADDGETTDDLVRDIIEVLTSMCARLDGRRGARNRAMRAVTAAKATDPVGVGVS